MEAGRESLFEPLRPEIAAFIPPAGTTVARFLESKDTCASDFTIRILSATQGRFTPTRDEIIQDNDRLSCVTLKVEGAV